MFNNMFFTATGGCFLHLKKQGICNFFANLPKKVAAIAKYVHFMAVSWRKIKNIKTRRGSKVPQHAGQTRVAMQLGRPQVIPLDFGSTREFTMIFDILH